MPDRTSSPRPVPCIGWLGRIFGHKFSSVERFHDNCQRCGIPQGVIDGKRAAP